MKTYSPFVATIAAFTIAGIVFITGSLVYASKGSSSSDDNSSGSKSAVEDRSGRHGADDGTADQGTGDAPATGTASQQNSVNDDGTPDQGSGDFTPTGTPVITPGNDDGTADQGSGDVGVGGAPVGQLEVEADVFTDITIVKVEINDAKSFYETATTDRDVLVQEIAAKFSLDQARVSAVLQFEIEDRASRPKDRT